MHSRLRKGCRWPSNVAFLENILISFKLKVLCKVTALKMCCPGLCSVTCVGQLSRLAGLQDMCSTTPTILSASSAVMPQPSLLSQPYGIVTVVTAQHPQP
jgi:hypothetical protein